MLISIIFDYIGLTASYPFNKRQSEMEQELLSIKREKKNRKIHDMTNNLDWVS